MKEYEDVTEPQAVEKAAPKNKKKKEADRQQLTMEVTFKRTQGYSSKYCYELINDYN